MTSLYFATSNSRLQHMRRAAALFFVVSWVAAQEWWIGEDVWHNLTGPTLKSVGVREAREALELWSKCPRPEFEPGQRNEVILNMMLRKYNIYDDTKRPEYFPCIELLDRQMPEVPPWTFASEDEATKRRSGYNVSGGGNVLFAVALVRDNAARTTHVEEHLVPKIPDLLVFNATDKQNSSQMIADFLSLGLDMRDTFSVGEAAWWITELRFMQLLLASDYEFAVLLQDDAVVQDDFVDRVHEIVSRITPQERTVGYRLGLWDFGLLIPRRSVPRVLGSVCAQKRLEWPTDFFSFKHIGCCPLFFDAEPFNNLVTEHVDIPSTITYHSNSHGNFHGTAHAFIPPPSSNLPLSSSDQGDIEPLCSTNYPGKVADPERLAVRFDREIDLRAECNLALHETRLARE
ncbi:hypothetical protein CTAYLR_007013 [Chrysophaeum taylorii]|uniref:Uncharacterized protein n=1 Tax=Chrysophaeum taylorii TaxID=2483200 RepID=A0AAD7U6T6_9STRA|nr:hypothetical protein CTAYLR_007013 [Chrysophaeum taylorii]